MWQGRCVRCGLKEIPTLKWNLRLGFNSDGMWPSACGLLWWDVTSSPLGYCCSSWNPWYWTWRHYLPSKSATLTHRENVVSDRPESSKTRLWLPQTSISIHSTLNIVICDICQFCSSYGSRSYLLVSLHKHSRTVCLGSLSTRRKPIPFTEFVQRWREGEVTFYTDKWDTYKLRRRNI